MARFRAAALVVGLLAGCTDSPVDPGSLCGCREVDGEEECCFGHGVCADQDEGPDRCECDEGALGDLCSTPAPGVQEVRPRACQGDDPGCARTFERVVVTSFDDCVDLDGEAFGSVIVRPAIDAAGEWPAGDPLPVAVFTHGASQEPGDYYDLLEHIAANGIVVAAFEATLAGDVTFRANRTLSYLQCLRGSWPDAAHLSDRYALVGHSRGGAAVAAAAEVIEAGLAAPGVELQAIVALAPSEGGQFPLPATVTPAYFTLQGARDPDTRGASLGWFDLAGGGASGFVRGLTWVLGATHQRFHQGLVAGGTGELQATLDAEGHWAVARAYVGGFLVWRLLGHAAYRPYFEGAAVPPSVAAHWDGAPGVFAGLTDGVGGRLVIHDFEAGLDPSTVGGTVTASGGVEATVGLLPELDAPWSLAHRGSGLRLDASGEGAIRFEVPAAATDVSSHAVLAFRAGRTFDTDEASCADPADTANISVVIGDGTTEATVRLTDLGEPGRIDPPDRFVPETIGNWVDGDCHALDFLRPIRIPLGLFCDAGLDPTAVTHVELRVDGGPPGGLLLDDLVFERGEGEGPGC